MNRSAAVLIALLATACSSNRPVTAQVPAPSGTQSPPTLHVNADATVKRAPDRAVVQLAVETLAPTAGEASAGNAEAMEQVLGAVRSAGVPSSDIRTQRLELRPRYEHRRDEDPEIVGYQAVNQVTIRLDDITIVGAVVDAAVRAGANRVSGIRFELGDPESAYHEALREAIASARAEAEVAAAALGMELGPPQQVSTGGAGHPPVPGAGPMMEAVRMTADAAGPPPVEAGEIEVRASVSIVWRLET